MQETWDWSTHAEHHSTHTVCTPKGPVREHLQCLLFKLLRLLNETLFKTKPPSYFDVLEVPSWIFQ